MSGRWKSFCHSSFGLLSSSGFSHSSFLSDIAFHTAASFNLRVQQPASQTGNPAPWFTPWRFALLLALLIFAAFPHVLLGLQTFVVRDYGFFAYPLAHFQQECFRHGELPMWNPYNNCGVPFLAQWNTMPLYPPTLIYLLLPLQWSLSFFCLLHLWFAGFGMFFLARRWTGLRRAEVSSVFGVCNARPVSAQLSGNEATATQAGNSFAAAFAGVAFAFNGLTLNLLMWPSHIATLSWMPWVVLAVELAWREGGRKIILAAFAGALQMLAGGPEIIFLTWILLLALWIQQLVTGGGDASSPTFSATGASQPRIAMLWRFPLVVALVLALAAAQLLPFLDLAAHSQRSTGYADTRWSMPGWGWANFLVPMAFGMTHTEGIFFQHGQYWTLSYYLGIGTLWLALLTVLGLQDRWAKIRGDQPIRVITDSKRSFQCAAEFCSERVWLLSVVAVIGLLCAFGENTPFYPALRKIIPQLSLMTYPIKYVILVAFSAPLLAAFALAQIFSLSSTKGGEGRGEEAEISRFQIPSPSRICEAKKNRPFESASFLSEPFCWRSSREFFLGRGDSRSQRTTFTRLCSTVCPARPF